MAKHHNPLLLPEDVRFFRTALNMTYEQLGEALGYHADSIYQLELPTSGWSMSDDSARKLIDIYLKDNSPIPPEYSSRNILDQLSATKAH